MGYIIVWRNSLTKPRIETTVADLKEEHSSYDDAKESAEANIRIAEGDNRKYYTDYAIYQQVTS